MQSVIVVNPFLLVVTLILSLSFSIYQVIYIYIYIYYKSLLSPFPQSQNIIVREAPEDITFRSGRLYRAIVSFPDQSSLGQSAIHRHELLHIYFSYFLIFPICIISYKRHILLLSSISNRYSIHKSRRRRRGQKWRECLLPCRESAASIGLCRGASC